MFQCSECLRFFFFFFFFFGGGGGEGGGFLSAGELLNYFKIETDMS